MSKPKTTNPNAIVRPRMLASTRDRLQELSAELSEDSYEGQRLVIEMAERAAVHMRDARISKNLCRDVQRENNTLKLKLESANSCYAIAEDGRLKALGREEELNNKIQFVMTTSFFAGFFICGVIAWGITTFL